VPARSPVPLPVRLTRRAGLAMLALALVASALAGVAVSRARTGATPGRAAVTTGAATAATAPDTSATAPPATAAPTTARPTTTAGTTRAVPAAPPARARTPAAASHCPARDVSRYRGVVTERVSQSRPPDGRTFDLRGMTSTAYGTSTLHALTFGITGSEVTAGGLCTLGGDVRSGVSHGRTWDDLNDHADGGALSFGTRSGVGVVDGLRADNVFDAISAKGDPPARIVVRNVWFTNIRDDCIENDTHPKTLTVHDSLLDGCFVGISERPGSDDGWHRPTGTTTLDRVLLRLQPMAYGTGCRYRQACTDGRGHHVFFKWSETATPSVVIRDSVLRMDRYSINGPTPMRFPPGTRAERAVLVWLGPGAYPHPLPPGMTLTRDVRVWERARADWLCRHRQGPC
jgi:hypothetical protein